ncbi:hypothetical protein HKCCE2091_03235 [Rhodobacterales bacterium HKCCE2091]|nr:hypothetical protein [Rhodobacterales bacterium HKCCE2091]
MSQAGPQQQLPEPAGARRRLAAAALFGGTLAALADVFGHNHAFAVVAALLVLIHILSQWDRVRANARAMLVAAVALSAVLLVLGGTAGDLALALSRALYLPALLAVMTLLRVAARRSRRVQVAAHFVIDQPPPRRFLYLATGAHVFGILLNVGGYQLLLGIALAERDRAAPPPEISAIQGRRITSAVMIGFGATLLWSPVGVAINLLIPIMPGLDWLEYMPYGLAIVVLFIGLGWVFDRLQPRPRRAFVPAPHDGAPGALLSLLALLLAITGTAVLAEAVAGVPMRAAVLVVIPVMAFAWVLLTEPGPRAANAGRLARDGFHALPDSVSEICLIGSTGYLGLIVAQMIPPEAVQAAARSLALGPGVIGCLMAAGITVVGLIGISPMISGSVAAGAVVAAGLPLPQPMIMVAALTGWATAMMLSPMTSTVAIAAGMAGVSSGTVGLRWNGLFVATFLVLSMAGMLVWGSFL